MILQALKPGDELRQKKSALNMLDELDPDLEFLKFVSISDESTLAVSGMLNRHDLSVWGIENPYKVWEQEWDT